jgi:hypothetical protein
MMRYLRAITLTTLGLAGCVVNADDPPIAQISSNAIVPGSTTRALTLRASVGGQFVTAENGGGGVINVNRATAQGWETFTLYDQNGGTLQNGDLINLGTFDGTHFWCAENGGGGAVNATRTDPQGWETFRVVKIGGTGAAINDGDQIALQTTVLGTFVSAVNGGGAGVTGTATTASTWETFVVGGGSGPVGGANPFGPNVVIFDPSIPQATIQSQINTIFNAERNNQFGLRRDAILFRPGTYNVDIPVGFFTEVRGLGAMPDDVNITNQVHSDPILPNNNATQNFWRGVENFSVTPPGAGMSWAVSQAIPFRRMHVRNNNLVLHLNGGFASGGWISDSVIDGAVNSGPQQQWISRNAQWGSWNGANWNMVFVGIPNNLPGGTWPNVTNTFVNPSPVTREKPFLIQSGASFAVYVPALRTNTNGITWGAGQTPGTSIPIEQFYIAKAGIDTAATINAALAGGKHLLLTPGVYDLNDTIRVTRANTIVLGLGFATLHPTTGAIALSVADVDGAEICGLFLDAGPVSSPVLIQVGPVGSTASHAANPTSLHDVFARIGGAGTGKAVVAMQINSANTIVDHTWLWRADHGDAGVGWATNTAQNGLVVNGANVTIYGLFVEHFQQYQVLWNANGGRVFFYQSEIPYDPPSQGVWRSSANVNGWASYKVADSVTTHEAFGLGIYAVFINAGVNLTRAIEVPNTPNVKFHHMITVNISNNGGISNVINNTGGATAPGVVQNTPKVTDFP